MFSLPPVLLPSLIVPHISLVSCALFPVSLCTCTSSPHWLVCIQACFVPSLCVGSSVLINASVLLLSCFPPHVTCAHVPVPQSLCVSLRSWFVLDGFLLLYFPCLPFCLPDCVACHFVVCTFAFCFTTCLPVCLAFRSFLCNCDTDKLLMPYSAWPYSTMTRSLTKSFPLFTS